VNDANDSFVRGEPGHKITRAIFFPLAESQIDNTTPQKLLPRDTGFRLKAPQVGSASQTDRAAEGCARAAADRALLNRCAPWQAWRGEKRPRHWNPTGTIL